MFDMQKSQEFFKELAAVNKKFYEDQTELFKKHFKVNMGDFDFNKQFDIHKQMEQFKELQNFFPKYDFSEMENKMKIMFEQNYEKFNKSMIDFFKLMDDAKTHLDKLMKK